MGREYPTKYGDVFVRRVKYCIKERKLSQEKLADQTSYSFDALKKALRRKECTKSFLDEIADALQISPEYLTGEENSVYETEKNEFINKHIADKDGLPIERLQQMFDESIELFVYDPEESLKQHRRMMKRGNTFVDPEGYIAPSFKAYASGLSMDAAERLIADYICQHHKVYSVEDIDFGSRQIDDIIAILQAFNLIKSNDGSVLLSVTSLEDMRRLWTILIGLLTHRKDHKKVVINVG